MTLPAGGFPRAVVASNSRANVALPSGASTFLGPTTPVGAKYGTSRNQAYLNLRPEADTPTAPSTTTYTFERPTPAAGWTFVLGDIDADKVSIAAGGVDGRPVLAATIDRWYRSSFNYAGGADQPVWDAATSTLNGNAAASDTDGAAAWFEPDVALTSLTFRFTARSGFPTYQTWFASTAHEIGGRVADSSTGGTGCRIDDSVMRLLAPDGATLATTSPNAGTYSFGQYATQAGYRVTVEAPAGCAVTGPEERTVDTTAGDAAADFALRGVLPQAVGGIVTDTDGAAVAGVDVTITPPSPGAARTTTTDADGRYLFERNSEQPGYQIGVTGVPDGFDVVGAASHAFDITPGRPVPAQDFTLREQPDVSGTVTGGGDPLGGVDVSITPTGGGTPRSTASTGDGRYHFQHVPAGQYTISVDPPPGYRPTPDRTDVTVTTQGLTGQDFHLTRPGAVSGTVSDHDGSPLPGVRVDIVGDTTGTRTVATDADGQFFLGDLDPDRYRSTVVVPTGYRNLGSVDRTATITAAGEIRGGQDFVLARTATPTTPSPASPTPAPSPLPSVASSSSGSVGQSGGAPAATGVDVGSLLVAGLSAIAAGLLLQRRSPRRRR